MLHGREAAHDREEGMGPSMRIATRRRGRMLRGVSTLQMVTCGRILVTCGRILPRSACLVGVIVIELEDWGRYCQGKISPGKMSPGEDVSED